MPDSTPAAASGNTPLAMLKIVERWIVERVDHEKNLPKDAKAILKPIRKAIRDAEKGGAS